MGRLILGKYEILERLGRGGMGEIYKASLVGAAGFSRVVVIKRMRESLAEDRAFVERFVKEAQLAATLDHPNIVQIHDLGEDEGSLFMVMEYVPGLDLRELIRHLARDGIAVAPELAAFIAIDVCKGLERAHGRLDESGRPSPVVHRDVSPQNVLLSLDGAVKLADFGLAVPLDDSGSDDAKLGWGKAAYMSPEQARGEVALDLRTDLFSLGVVLFEAVAGRRAYGTRDRKELLKRVLAAEIPPLEQVVSTVPPVLASLAGRLLAVDREDRPGSASEVRRELSAFLRLADPPVDAAVLGAVVRRAIEEGARSSSGPVSKVEEAPVEIEATAAGGAARIPPLYSRPEVRYSCEGWEAFEQVYAESIRLRGVEVEVREAPPVGALVDVVFDVAGGQSFRFPGEVFRVRQSGPRADAALRVGVLLDLSTSSEDRVVAALAEVREGKLRPAPRPASAASAEAGADLGELARSMQHSPPRGSRAWTGELDEEALDFEVDLGGGLVVDGEPSQAQPTGSAPTGSMSARVWPPPQLGRYELLAELGGGGMAVIYLARVRGPSGINKPVALKLIRPHLSDDPHFVELLVAEARLACLLDHPNVVHVLELGEAEGTTFVAMECLAGQTVAALRGRLGRGARGMDPRLAVSIVAQAAEGLHYAHELKDPTGRPFAIVHRDVSPPNIFVTYAGGVKVLDFGVARAAGRAQVTAPGTVKGKFPYMAPEAVLQGKVDRRADVFALGTNLWEMLTGERLFRDEDALRTLERLCSAPIPRVDELRPELPPALAHVVARALERDPAARTPSALALRHALARALRDGGGLASTAEIAASMAAAFEPEQTAWNILYASSMASGT